MAAIDDSTVQLDVGGADGGPSSQSPEEEMNEALDELKAALARAAGDVGDSSSGVSMGEDLRGANTMAKEKRAK